MGLRNCMERQCRGVCISCHKVVEGVGKGRASGWWHGLEFWLRVYTLDNPQDVGLCVITTHAFSEIRQMEVVNN